MARPPVTVPRWRVTADEAGSRLDKFLASPDRLGSRSRVVTALERGRVFVNDVEAAAADGASRVDAGDDVCVWTDRPGTARRRPDAVRRSPLRIIFEDDDLIVLEDRKSTRLNSSHSQISYAVFCLKKKKKRKKKNTNI